VKSLVMVPVRPEDPIAAIGAYWARRHHATHEEVTLLEALAGFAALALENEALLRELRGAIDARDEFLSLASHELRTPLTALRLLLTGGLRPGVQDPERLRGVLARADGLVGRLGGIVTNLLDASRGGPDARALERVPLDLGEVVARIVARAGGAARTRLSLRCDGPVRGRWDPDRLEQIVDHLVNNALKFGCERPVSIEVARAGARASIVVRDGGIGIAEGDRERIFDRFERAVSSRHFGGFGMGLWIVRRNVDAHGGTVDVQSRPGEGATFTVWLPLEPPAGETRPAAH
jgi:signal transduction histidine kinase